jgi:TolB protein
MKRLAGLAVAAALIGVGDGSHAATGGAGRIAFSYDRNDISAIFTVRPDGTGLHQLTHPIVHQGLGGDSGPVWSTDGRRLAFERDLPYWGSDRFRVNIVDAAGHKERPVTAGPFDVMPTWSPDRHRLAFVRLVIGAALTDSSIYLWSPRRTSPLIAGNADLTPAWSPDGRTIAFARLGADLLGTDAQLFLAAADGADVRPLGIQGVQPAWSPDGRQLAFISYTDRNGQTCGGNDCSWNGELYVVNADGSGLRRLTTSKADDAHPSWSPDGRSIAFTSGYELLGSGHAPWLMVVPSAGGTPRRIGRLAGVHDPSWSPASVH